MYCQFPNCVFGICIDGNAILFEDVKHKGSSQQIPFTGVLFVILGMKRVDCTHGVDRCTLIKEKRLERKKKTGIKLVL